MPLTNLDISFPKYKNVAFTNTKNFSYAIRLSLIHYDTSKQRFLIRALPYSLIFKNRWNKSSEDKLDLCGRILSASRVAKLVNTQRLVWITSVEAVCIYFLINNLRSNKESENNIKVTCFV